MDSFRFRVRIVPTGRKLPWLQAREAVKDKGGLPPHWLLDEHLCSPAYQKTLSPGQKKEIDDAFPLWSRHLLAYPESDGVFWPEQPIQDSETHVHLPVSLVPYEVVGRPGAGLLLDPVNIHPEGDYLHIHSAFTKAVFNLPQHGASGLVDPATGIPFEVAEMVLARADRHFIRSLLRITQESIRPLVRYVRDFNGGGRNVDAYYGHGVAFGVAYVEYDLVDAANQVLLEGVSLAELIQFANGEKPPIFMILHPFSDFDHIQALAQKAIARF